MIWLCQTQKNKAESFNTDEKGYLKMIKLVNSTETVVNLCTPNGIGSKIFTAEKEQL